MNDSNNFTLGVRKAYSVNKNVPLWLLIVAKRYITLKTLSWDEFGGGFIMVWLQFGILWIETGQGEYN